MDTLSQIALALTPGIGCASIRKLAALYPGEDIFGLPPAEIKAAFGAHGDIARHIMQKSAFARAEEELRFAERHGVRVLFCTDPAFPARLNRTETADCPALLYALGPADLNPQRSVAVVGTRKATPQGRDTTARLVGQLKPYGTPVVSGLAYGIDTAAHAAALEQGLPTVAVLGHGLDRVYPPENRRLAADIVDAGGALLTEFPSGTAINPRHFPARNRIIAALADAVVVVEASAKGGALITAGIATGYHREVFAVPGRLSDTYSTGTNNLIATNKATLIRTADDIAYQLGWPMAGPGRATDNQQRLFADLPPGGQAVLDLLHQHGSLTLDELAALGAMPMPKMAALLFDLELAKAVRCLPGRIYQATD